MNQENLFEKVNQETPIYDLVSEFVVLKKSGKGFVGLCPFHNDSNPSFSVSVEKNIAMCFTCKKGGNPINFYKEIKGISAIDAALQLAKRLNLDVGPVAKPIPFADAYEILNETTNFYQYNLTHSKAAESGLTYLKERGLTDVVINKLRIGFAPHNRETLKELLTERGFTIDKLIDYGVVSQAENGRYYDFFANRIMFPIVNENMHVVGFTARTIDHQVKAKYINSLDTKVFNKRVALYNFGIAARSMKQSEEVIVHEGVFDVIASMLAGFDNVVATLGTNLTKEHLLKINKFTNKVVLVFDPDQAGVTASIKAYEVIKSLNMLCELVLLPNKMDPHDFLMKKGIDAYQTAFKKRYDIYQFAYLVYAQIDFGNANQVVTFKQQMTNVLKSAEPSIKDKYLQFIQDKHNITLNLKHTLVAPIKSPAPTKTKTTQTKAYHAANRLLAHFLLTNHLLEKVEQTLVFPTPIQHTIFAEIINYYQTTNHDQVIIADYYQLNPNQVEFITSEITNKVEFRANMQIQDVDELNAIIDQINANLFEQEMLRLQTKLQESNNPEEKQAFAAAILKKQKEKRIREKKHEKG